MHKFFSWKKVLFFFIVLVLFMLPSFIFRKDVSFYKELILPSFAPKPIVFGIAWSILYLIQSLFITIIYFQYESTEGIKNLKILLFLNFVFNILYMPIFFKFHQLFGGFVICLLVLTTLILVILKSRELKISYLYLEIPYLLWSVFATILAGFIYFLN